MLETELGRQTELFSPFQSRSDLVQLEGAYIFLAAVRPRPQLDELQVLRYHIKRTLNVTRDQSPESVCACPDSRMW